MKRVLILVEGQTEERFVKRLLTDHLVQHDVCIVPTIVVTKRVKSGPNFKGGIISYANVRGDILRLLGDTDAALVTTMFDFYGLPQSFPGRSQASGIPQDKVLSVEEALDDDIDDNRFKGYLALHEFEGLLFSSPGEIARALHGQNKEQTLHDIRNSFDTPEDINDDPATAPSKRILDTFPEYKKSVYGPIIASRIGLSAIRDACPHFDKWISRLENVS